MEDIDSFKNNFWDCNIITLYPFPFHPQTLPYNYPCSLFLLCMSVPKYINTTYSVCIKVTLTNIFSELRLWYWITHYCVPPWGRLLLSALLSFLWFFAIGLRPQELSSIHVYSSIGIIFVQLMFRQQCCWDLISIVSDIKVHFGFFFNFRKASSTRLLIIILFLCNFCFFGK